MMSHAALLTALILERPLCIGCIATKSARGAADVEATLAIVQVALRLHTEVGRCRGCGHTTTVVFLDRPA